MFTFLLVVHAIIAALLVGFILIQKSEGGGLTSGGSNSGLMSARGTADFLTRSTSILAALFVGMAILLAVFAANQGSSRIDTTLATKPAPATQQLPPAGQTAFPQAAPSAAPGNSAAPGDDIPLQQ